MGFVKERQECSIPGCSSLKGLNKSTRKDNSFYYYETPQCSQHRSDGQRYAGPKYQYNYDKNRENHWKTQGINLTIEQYHQLLRFQNERCFLCGRHQSVFKRALNVDHCHKTGKIRGLICSRCNMNLGWIEKTSHLDELKDYLEGDIVSRYGDIF